MTRKATKSTKTPANRGKNTKPWTPVALISHKRDQKHFTETQINEIITGFVSGKITDYQMSALAMAIYLNGMNPQETTWLTLAMRDSGTTIPWPRHFRLPKVDKHSTGGVGDKVSICLAPMVAACGVAVPMVSGRGLGHTGGTLDKLEAIPGFQTQIPTKNFVEQVRRIGCSLIGQTGEIAPADKRLYALRDVTATVESIPLITASILSKKLAENIDALVLDVKVGNGAFMSQKKDAIALARSIIRVGKLAGKKVSAVLTNMEQPLGHAIGNALETAEAIDILHGRGPADVLECTLALGVEMLRLAGTHHSDKNARNALTQSLRDGSAARKLKEIIKAQGGDPKVVDDPKRLPRSPHRTAIPATKSGYVHAIDTKSLGQVAVSLGAGRLQAEDTVNPAVGLKAFRKIGDRVRKGEILAEVHHNSKSEEKAFHDEIATAFVIRSTATRSQKVILDRIR